VALEPRRIGGEAVRILPLLIFAYLLACGTGALAEPVERASITSEQREVIRRHILQEKRPSIIRPAGAELGVGSRMSDDVEVFWMPPGAGLNRYRYAVVNRRALVLDYQNRRVMEIIEQAP
jgi:hypothetical protein